MKKEVYKKTNNNLLAETQSHFDLLARAARHGLQADTSSACRALMIQMARFIELLQRDQRRELC